MKKKEVIEPKLNSAQELFKEMLAEAKAASEKAYNSYHGLKQSCQHAIGASFVKTKYGYEGRASCIICGEYFGHYCPKSSDLHCHYYSVNGYIHLSTGEKIPVAEDHDPRYETDDCCLFCGMPDERK